MRRSVGKFQRRRYLGNVQKSGNELLCDRRRNFEEDVNGAEYEMQTHTRVKTGIDGVRVVNVSGQFRQRVKRRLLQHSF